MNRITSLFQNEFKVLKVIRIENINRFQYFSGHLYYIRKLTKEYSAETPDFVDKMIFDAIKKIYPTAIEILNRNIFFQGQQEEMLTQFNGKDDLDFQITFTPFIPLDKYDQISQMEIYGYTKKLFLKYHSMTNKDLPLIVMDHFQTEIPFEKIQDFNAAIKTIEFKK